MALEDRNVSLRGRCKESDTLWKSWQAQYFVDMAKTLAGVCHSKDCIAFYVAGTGNTHHGSYILRSKGSIPEKGCIFGIWTWGSVCVASAAFRMTSGHDFVVGAVLPKHVSIFVEVSQKTLVLELRIFSFRGSLAQNVRFGAPDSQFSKKSRTKRSFTRSWCKWSKRTLLQRSWDRDLAEVVLQDLDRSGPTGSWYRDLAYVVL